MPSIAYCNDCGRYVELTAPGDCPSGHPRSGLRDVRSGTLTSAPAVGVARRSRGSEPDYTAHNEIVAELLGKGIVIVPVTLIVVWGLWTGYEQFSGSGMSVGMKLLLSALSLLGTVGAAFLMMGRRRKR